MKHFSRWNISCLNQGYSTSKKGLANQQQILSDVVDKLFEKWPLKHPIVFTAHRQPMRCCSIFTLGVAYHGQNVFPLRSTSTYANATPSSSPKWPHLPKSSIVGLRFGCSKCGLLWGRPKLLVRQTTEKQIHLLKNINLELLAVPCSHRMFKVGTMHAARARHAP